MRFWWVNHNQTARQEIEGGFLWSPKRESGGARSRFYDNMREAAPGDLVLSYSRQAVRFVGQVTDYAFTALKPPEFGSLGSYWEAEGWLLPVSWIPVEAPVSPKALISTLGPMLPEKYSPIHRETGAGNQKAYLAEVPPAVFQIVARAAEFPDVDFSRPGANSRQGDLIRELIEDHVESILNSDLTLDSTVRKSVIDARRGQGQFRSNVLKVCPACPLTGVTNPALLIASHIKPWRVCTTPQERLDGLNGLMLTPDADLLFDRGFIGFGEAGEVMVSGRFDREDLNRLGLGHVSLSPSGLQDASAAWQAQNLNAAREAYLAYHRENVFLAG
jgi:hypothetical protein